MMIRSRKSGAGRKYAYTCGHAWLRGTCTVHRTWAMESVDAHVLKAFRTQVLAPVAVERMITNALARLKVQGPKTDAQKTAVQCELAALEQELGRLVEAVSSGAGSVPALVRRLQDRNRRREELENQLRFLDGQVDRRDLVTEADLRAEVAEWTEFLDRNKGTARQVLRKCLDDRLRFARRPPSGRRWWSPGT